MAPSTTVSDKSASPPCPCAPERRYAHCCGPFHHGEIAPTPQALMRSRYSAYMLGLLDYLLLTWHHSTRPALADLREDSPRKWLGLSILHSPDPQGDSGVVEYLARFKINGRAHRLQETSRFVREQGRWFYLDGDIHD